jgi:hypothetical protein
VLQMAAERGRPALLDRTKRSELRPIHTMVSSVRCASTTHDVCHLR